MNESIIKSAKLAKIKREMQGQTWDEHILSVEATIDFELWFSECESWIMPTGEYELVDESNESHFWLDDFLNVHWLVKVSSGHIHHKVVPIKDKIQEIADEKYSEWQYDQELEHSKF